MNLLEKDIEDIIYSSPWILDERYIIPKIKGSRNEFGRQINVGGVCLNRYIDLLFKDTRDERPVIVELKKNQLKREDIGQILEYKALLVSMEECSRDEWQSEFGKNYYYPKLILIGTGASEEVKITANLVGIEIRILVGVEELEVNFKSIDDINKKLNNWNEFLNTGNRTLEDRMYWIEETYEWCKDAINNSELKEQIAINDLFISKPKGKSQKGKQGWIDDLVYPFINIGIYYKEEGLDLCGIYEYFDENMPFSDEHIYFDFVIRDFAIRRIYYQENENELEVLANEVKKIFSNSGYDIFNFKDGIVVTKIPRKVLSSYDKFKATVIELIEYAIYVNSEINEKFSYNK